MKIICNQKLLANKIGISQKAINGKTTLELLKGILLSAKDGQLKLTGYDLEIGIETYTQAEVIEEGEIVVNARLFGDIIRKLPDSFVEIETDAVRLRQVIEHLLDNAAKFTVKGHIDIGYALSDHGEKIYVFVADTGCGIPSDQYKKVFERFYKINSFVQGAGLGLSVCKTIVEGLGGTINVYSQLKEGSRFSVILPLNRLHK